MGAVNKVTDTEKCPEPGGNEMIQVTDTETISAHDLAMDEMGHCPWCGSTGRADGEMDEV